MGGFCLSPSSDPLLLPRPRCRPTQCKGLVACPLQRTTARALSSKAAFWFCILVMLQKGMGDGAEKLVSIPIPFGMYAICAAHSCVPPCFPVWTKKPASLLGLSVITGNFVCGSHRGCVNPRDRNSDVEAGTRGFGSAEPGQALALPLRG